MSTSRDEFEAWQSREGVSESDLADKCSEGAPRAGEYRSLRLQDDWDAWQASRRAALEEAAHACDTIADDGNTEWGVASGAQICAEAIRALTTSPTTYEDADTAAEKAARGYPK